MAKNNFRDLHEKMNILNKQTFSYTNEIKELLSQLEVKPPVNTISYFTYSLNLAHDEGEENLIIGSFHVLNSGGKPINNPYICIKMSQDTPFQFSGKYLNDPSKLQRIPPGAWERLNDQHDQEEFWLKPIEKKVIQPNETIAFTNFQVKWFPKESYTGTIMGFMYSDELQEGLGAINQISLSGMSQKRRGEDE